MIGVRALAPLLAERRPRPRWRTRLVADQGLRWFRTSLFGRIPAFAPGPAPVGPWRPVTLVHRRDVALDDLLLRAGVDDGDGVVTVQRDVRPLGCLRADDRAPGRSDELSRRSSRSSTNGPRLVVRGSARVPGAEPLVAPHARRASAARRHGVVLSDGAARCRGRSRTRRLPRAPRGGRPGSRAVRQRHAGLLPRRLPAAAGARSRPAAARAARRCFDRFRDAGMNMIRLSGVGVYGSDELFAPLRRAGSARLAGLCLCEPRLSDRRRELPRRGRARGGRVPRARRGPPEPGRAVRQQRDRAAGGHARARSCARPRLAVRGAPARARARSTTSTPST